MRQRYEGETQEEVDKEERDIAAAYPNKEVWEIQRGTPLLPGSFLVLADNAEDALFQARQLLEKRHEGDVYRINGIKKIGDIFVPLGVL